MIKVKGESGTGVNKKVGTAAPSSASKEKGGKESRGRCPSSLSPPIDLVDRGNRREQKAPRHASTLVSSRASRKGGTNERTNKRSAKKEGKKECEIRSPENLLWGEHLAGGGCDLVISQVCFLVQQPQGCVCVPLLLSHIPRQRPPVFVPLSAD